MPLAIPPPTGLGMRLETGTRSDWDQVAWRLFQSFFLGKGRGSTHSGRDF